MSDGAFIQVNRFNPDRLIAVTGILRADSGDVSVAQDGVHYLSPDTGALSGHNHDGSYLGLTAIAYDSTRLGGQTSGYYSTSGHNHDGSYLGLHAVADDSALLGGSPSGTFALSGHNHDSNYLATTGIATDSLLLNGLSSWAFSASGHTHNALYQPLASGLTSLAALTPDGLVVRSGGDYAILDTGVFSASGHNHDLTYLALSGVAANSLLLGGLASGAYSPSGHNHDSVYLPTGGTAVNAQLLDSLDSTAFAQLALANSFTGAQTITSNNLLMTYDGTGLVLQNNTLATSGAGYKQQFSPSIVLAGHGWYTDGGVDQLNKMAIVLDPATDQNPKLRFYYKLTSGGAWTQFQAMDRYAQYEYTVRYAKWDNREVFNNGFDLGNDAAATVGYSQYSPAFRLYSKGWTKPTGGSAQYMSCAFLAAPEQGTDAIGIPVGVFKYIYNTNNAVPSLTNEIMRLEWGGRSRVATKVPLHVNVPTGAPTLVENSSVSMYLDEVSGSLVAKIKTSAGVDKTVTLTFDP